MNNMQKNENLLRGWKEIEDYIRLTRNTILENGYPIRADKRKRVYAFKNEIDAFMLREKASYTPEQNEFDRNSMN